VKFTQLDAFENKLFDNFYQSQTDQPNLAEKKQPNSIAEIFRKNLYEKLGIKENEQSLVLTEFGNKMWEIKKRLNNHMSYLKKKLFFEKLDELFIQIILENRLSALKITGKLEKNKLINALILLKPFIFSQISNNNMIFDGIKILFISKRVGTQQNSLEKIRSLLKKIKAGLAKIIIESIKNLYKNNKGNNNTQALEVFSMENMYYKKNFDDDSLMKKRNDLNFNQIKDENQFSDLKMRRKNIEKKSIDLSKTNNSLNLAKTNINFQIQSNKVKEKLRSSSRGFKHRFSETNFANMNIDKICYYYLNRLNMSG